MHQKDRHQLFNPLGLEKSVYLCVFVHTLGVWGRRVGGGQTSPSRLGPFGKGGRAKRQTAAIRAPVRGEFWLREWNDLHRGGGSYWTDPMKHETWKTLWQYLVNENHYCLHNQKITKYDVIMGSVSSLADEVSHARNVYNMALRDFQEKVIWPGFPDNRHFRILFFTYDISISIVHNHFWHLNMKYRLHM